jgi:hypothetical protein
MFPAQRVKFCVFRKFYEAFFKTEPLSSRLRAVLARSLFVFRIHHGGGAFAAVVVV